MTATKTSIATLDALDAAAQDGFLTALIDESGSHPALNHLHCLVDDQHLADLLAVSRELAGTEETRKQLRQGMLTALDLRCELWDVLYHRATSYQPVSSA